MSGAMPSERQRPTPSGIAPEVVDTWRVRVRVRGRVRGRGRVRVRVRGRVRVRVRVRGRERGRERVSVCEREHARTIGGSPT